MLSANSESSTSFPIWISFISFYVLIAVPKTFKTMLSSSGESGHPCLVPDFRGKAFNFSPLRIMFVMGLSYIAFIMLRYVPSIPAFWRVFIINGCWILSKALWDSVCWNFVKDFCIYVHQWYWPVKLQTNFLLFCVASLILVLGWWWPHRMSLEVYLPLQFSGRVW